MWELLSARLYREPTYVPMWPAALSVSWSQAARLGIDNRNLWKSWMTKTRWGFSSSLSRGELMQRYYLFSLFCVCLPHFVLGGGNYRRETRSHDRAAVTDVQFHHYRKWTSQTLVWLKRRLQMSHGSLAQKSLCHSWGCDLNRLSVKIWTFAFYSWLGKILRFLWYFAEKSNRSKLLIN